MGDPHIQPGDPKISFDLLPSGNIVKTSYVWFVGSLLPVSSQDKKKIKIMREWKEYKRGGEWIRIIVPLQQ